MFQAAKCGDKQKRPKRIVLGSRDAAAEQIPRPYSRTGASVRSLNGMSE